MGKKYLISFVMAWVGMLVSGVVRAACSSEIYNRFTTFDMGTHYIPRDAPIGSVIGAARQEYKYAFPGVITCKQGDEFSTWSNWPAVTGVTLPPSWEQATILKTNIPGVGMIVETSWFAKSGWRAVSGNFGFTPYTIERASSSVILNSPGGVNFTLVKTSNAIPAGATNLVNGTTPVRFYSADHIFFSVFVTGSVIRSECSLPSSGAGGKTYIDVPMGNVQRRDFNGKDSYLRSKDFTIPLTSCVAGTFPTDQSWNFYQNSSVHIKFEGAGGSPIIDASKGIVGLTSNSTAKGVALQIMRKDGVTPMKLNENVNIAQVAGTSMNIDLKARYIQTSENPLGPEPGVANAKAAFTVTYK